MAYDLATNGILLAEECEDEVPTPTAGSARVKLRIAYRLKNKADHQVIGFEREFSIRPEAAVAVTVAARQSVFSH